MCRTVLADGRHEDLISLLNRDRLLAQWPVLLTLVSGHRREVWEGAFPELAIAETSAALGVRHSRATFVLRRDA